MRFLALIFICFSFGNIYSQIAPIAVYGYNSCNLSEETSGFYGDGVDLGNISCECGVVESAMLFNGVDDYALLDEDLKDLLQNDFTFSFYFFTNSHAVPAPIFAVKDSCLNRDSSFLIKYLPLNDEIEISIGENIADLIVFKEALDPSKCWHHVSLTKRESNYSFFLNGNFVRSEDIGMTIPLGVNHPVEIANSSCVGIVDQRFHGLLDEISFYDMALSSEEIKSLYNRPDEILNADTTIFQGNPVIIEFEGSCGNVSWNPTTDLNIQDINPVATPQQSTQYIATIDYGNCITRDSININVVTEDDITCNQLLLPNAFTPNGDGINDVFGISNLFIVDQVLEFTIYDRWGGKVFNSITKGEQWNGFVNGEAVNPGMYAYKIRYNCSGDEYDKIGSVSVLR